MNNSDRQYYKKEGELPLSKRLTQEFICSPLLRRNGQPAKESKRFGKNPDVNLLFDDEKPKVKTRRTEKFRRVIDLSDAIRKQIVRIDEKKLTSGDRAQKLLSKRGLRWTEKQNPTTMSYFVEMDTKRLSTKIAPGSTSDNSRIP
uniref:Uncharacterized protein n=1 Tax=Lygus hesperus TaxID=30085 RepID=A0A0A9Z725_LYGHE